MGRSLKCLANLLIKTAIISSLAILLAFTYCEMDEDDPVPKFLEVYPYDFSNNGRFNLPLFEIITSEYDLAGKFIYGHAMNTFIFGNPSSSGSLCPIEPQNDFINVKFGEDPLLGINTKVFIRGTPVLGTTKYIDGKKDISMNWYIKQDIKDKIPTSTWINPDLIITETEE